MFDLSFFSNLQKYKTPTIKIITNCIRIIEQKKLYAGILFTQKKKKKKEFNRRMFN